MSNVTNDQLSPEDVMTMPLAEFEQRFGFRPDDAFEKRYFAITAERPDGIDRAMVAAMGPAPDLSGVVME